MIQCKQDNTDKTWCEIKEQIERLGQLENYPDPQFKPKAFKELCLALLCADSLAIARAVVDSLAQYGRLPCPFALDIREATYAANEAASGEQAEVERLKREKWAKESRRPIPTNERELLAEHKRVLVDRMAELRGNPALNRTGPDGRKVQTELLDRLEELAVQISGKSWDDRCRAYTGRTA